MNRGQLKSSLRAAAVVGLLVLLAACARQIPEGVAHDAQTPGFWWGLWHGFIFPWSWIGTLFQPTVAVYAVPNTGGWYDFGYFRGVTVLGGGSFFGSRKARRE